MKDQPSQGAYDEWNDQLLNSTYRLSVTLKELHEKNPWPQNPVLDQAINTFGD